MRSSGVERVPRYLFIYIYPSGGAADCGLYLALMGTIGTSGSAEAAFPCGIPASQSIPPSEATPTPTPTPTLTPTLSVASRSAAPSPAALAAPPGASAFDKGDSGSVLNTWW